MNWGVFVSTFLAASIEVIEMVAIVVAVGVTRSWRAGPGRGRRRSPGAGRDGRSARSRASGPVARLSA